MNNNHLVTYFICLLFASSYASNLFAESTAHQKKQISYIQKEIQKYDERFIGKANVNKSSVKRSLRLLKMSRQRLDKLADHSTPAWKQTSEQYNQLLKQMNSLLNKNTSAPEANSKTVSTPSVKTSHSISKSSSKQMISQYRVRIKKIIRDINSAMSTLKNKGNKVFQEQASVDKYLQSSNRFKQSLQKYHEYKDDSDVINAAKELQNYNTLIANATSIAQENLKKLGNVQERLRKIDTTMHKNKVPAVPNQPYKKGQLSQWLVDIYTLRQTLSNMFKPLPEIKKIAYLPLTRETVQSGAPYDMHDVDRIQRGIISSVKKIDATVKKFGQNLESNVKEAEKSLEFYNKFKPGDKSDQANYLLGKGKANKIRKQLSDKLAFVTATAEYSKKLKHKSYQDRLSVITKIKDAQSLFEKNHAKALSMVRMPKAKSTDSGLIKVANKTLAGYDYVGKIKRLVINSEKVHRSKDTSESTIDDMNISLGGKITMSGTTTTYHYEWDQFQVATAEKDGDKYYIYYNTLKYYTSGASNTPLNKWIISNRIQSSEIPEKSIKLD